MDINKIIVKYDDDKTEEYYTRKIEEDKVCNQSICNDGCGKCGDTQEDMLESPAGIIDEYNKYTQEKVEEGTKALKSIVDEYYEDTPSMASQIMDCPANVLTKGSMDYLDMEGYYILGGKYLIVKYYYTGHTLHEFDEETYVTLHYEMSSVVMQKMYGIPCNCCTTYWDRNHESGVCVDESFNRHLDGVVLEYTHRVYLDDCIANMCLDELYGIYLEQIVNEQLLDSDICEVLDEYHERCDDYELVLLADKEYDFRDIFFMEIGRIDNTGKDGNGRGCIL